MTTEGELLEWDEAHGTLNKPDGYGVYDTTGTAIRFMPVVSEAGTEGTEGAKWLTAALDGHIAVVEPESDPPLRTPLLSLPDLDYGASVGILDVATTSTGAVTVDPSGRLITWDLTGLPPLGPRLVSDRGIDQIAAMADGWVVAQTGEFDGVMRLDGECGAVRSRIDRVDATVLATRGDVLAVGTDTGEVLVGSKTLDGARSLGPRHESAVVGVASPVARSPRSTVAAGSSSFLGQVTRGPATWI